MFTTDLKTKQVRVGEWALFHPLIWKSEDGPLEITIRVPPLFITDYASVPGFMRPLLVDADEDKRPFVLHDWLYCSNKKGKLSRQQADELLRVAMIETKHGKLKAWTYYYGVRLGGWRYWHKKAQTGLTSEDVVR